MAFELGDKRHLKFKCQIEKSDAFEAQVAEEFSRALMKIYDSYNSALQSISAKALEAGEMLEERKRKRKGHSASLKKLKDELESDLAELQAKNTDLNFLTEQKQLKISVLAAMKLQATKLNEHRKRLQSSDANKIHELTLRINLFEKNLGVSTALLPGRIRVVFNNISARNPDFECSIILNTKSCKIVESLPKLMPKDGEEIENCMKAEKKTGHKTGFSMKCVQLVRSKFISLF